MKKRLVSLLAIATMTASMFAACGKTEAPAADSNDAAPADGATVDAPAGGEGQVLNIYCWNEEFKSRLTDHYPGYTEVDGTHGTIGDVQVVWNITPSTDNAYQNNLDENL